MASKKSMPDIAIREMHEEDLGEVSRILCADYRFLAEREGFTDEQLNSLLADRGSEASVREQRRVYSFRVAEGKDGLVGAAAVRGSELTKLYVDPPFHRNGIGGKLFGAALRLIRQDSHEEMVLGAFRSAIPFYERMGMTVSRWKTIDCGPLVGRRQAIMAMSLADE